MEIGKNSNEWHYSECIFWPISNLIRTSLLKEMENITVLPYITDPPICLISVIF